MLLCACGRTLTVEPSEAPSSVSEGMHITAIPTEEFEDYSEYLLYKKSVTDASFVAYEAISELGSFKKLTVLGDAVKEYRYYLQDANNVKYSFEIFNSANGENTVTDSGCLLTEEKPNMRRTEEERIIVIEFDNITIRYLYNTDMELTRIQLTVDDYHITVSSSSGLTALPLCDYPTDGKETFISRLLDSTTATEAAAELAKKILAEQE